MHVSELDLNTVKEYLRVDGEEDDNLIKLLLESARSHVKSYTGLTDEQIDKNDSLVIPILALVSGFYDNRTISITDKLNLRTNTMIEAILSQHCVNLL